MLTTAMPAKPLTPEQFVALLRAWIERKGHSQREAAIALDVPLPTLESWLRRTRNPNTMAIRALLPLLNP